MDKKGAHQAENLRTLLFVFIVVITVYFLQQKPTVTFLAVYEEIPQEKNWNFDNPEDYLYDPSLINITGGEVKLIPEIVTSNWTTEQRTEISVTSAILRELDNNGGDEENEEEEPEDKTAEITSLDGQFVNLNKNGKLLDISFNTALDNDDIISLYILKGKKVQTDIYLCDKNTTCDPPGYGLVNFNEDKGWYNITLSGLSSPQSTFAVDPPNNVKIDYIKATHIEIQEHSQTNITYPSSAEIETLNFQPDNLKNWDTFSSNHQLNNQSITYQYSTDSGTTWENIPENQDLSPLNSTKIRIKAILTSDETETPALNSLSLTYIIQLCQENWTEYYGDCLAGDSKLKYYSDENECGTTNHLPQDNGTYQSCNYCLLHNCSASFQESFSLTENSLFEINALNKTNTILKINSSQNIENAVISIIKYNQTLTPSLPQTIPINKYLDIQSNAENINSVKIIIYYTDEELNSQNIDENTLKLYHYNQTSQQWQELNSTVNTTGNYVYAILSHLSLYGLFGQEKQQVKSPTPSPSSGGGGGRRRTLIKKETPSSETTQIKIKPKAESPPSQEIPPTETTCNYVLEISLPHEISFVEEDSFQGEILNKGNCDLQRINLYLSPELENIITLPTAYFEKLKTGNKTNFLIIRKSEKKKAWLNFLTSSAITTFTTTKTISGALTFEAIIDQKPVFQKDLPLNIKIETSSGLINTRGTLIGASLIFLLFIFFFFKKKEIIKKRKKKKPKKDPKTPLH